MTRPRPNGNVSMVHTSAEMLRSLGWLRREMRTFSERAEVATFRGVPGTIAFSAVVRDGASPIASTGRQPVGAGSGHSPT